MSKNYANSMLELFDGLDRAYGKFTIKSKNATKQKMEGKATTVLGEVDKTLWEAHLRGEQGIGIVPIRADNTAVFGAIDIDVYVDFDLEALEKNLTDGDVPVVVCRTKSGGAHLYMFTKEPVPAALIRGKLIELADMIGYGNSEVFPKQSSLASERDVGSWINMPYFGASLRGDESTERYAIYKGKRLVMVDFLKLAMASRLTQEQLECVEFTTEVTAELEDAPPCLVKLCIAGIPEGNRNNALFNLGVYCRLRHGDDWEQHLEDLNIAHIDPPLGSREVLQLMKQLQKKKYYYKCEDEPIVGECNKRVCRSRKYGVGGDIDAPTYELGSLTKIDSTPPTWFLDVDGVRFECDTDDLIVQEKFRKICVEKLNKIPRKLKPLTWEKIITRLLENVEVVEAPEDSGPRGQFLAHFDTFLSINKARNQDQLLRGKRYYDEDGRVYFRSTDLITYLKNQKFNEFRSNAIWAMLRSKDMQAKHHQFQLKGKCCHCWSVPAPEEQTEEHTMPTDPQEHAEKAKEGDQF